LGELGRPVAVAGTATTLAAIDLGGYDPVRVHRHRLTRRRVEEILARLASLPLERRRAIPGLDPARAGVITAGAAILATVLEVAGADEVMISERDILDGVALAAAGRLGDTFHL
jgi:exopolyphosphatase/guanosine-5'-triphosphate,3'-diphosphate pyrophosphatase